MQFQLNQKLEEDTFLIKDLPLCRLLLMNDSRYPWLILVPRIAGLRDIDDTPAENHALLWHEINFASQALKQHCAPYKLNVAALGNQVEQLHIHVIARNRDDHAWPGPVWGVGTTQNYSADQAEAMVTDLLAILK